jgi:hypothetical protein
MSLQCPDYTNPFATGNIKEAYEAGIREGRRQMLDEMLKFHNQKIIHTTPSNDQPPLYTPH